MRYIGSSCSGTISIAGDGAGLYTRPISMRPVVSHSTMEADRPSMTPMDASAKWPRKSFSTGTVKSLAMVGGRAMTMWPLGVLRNSASSSRVRSTCIRMPRACWSRRLPASVGVTPRPLRCSNGWLQLDLQLAHPGAERRFGYGKQRRCLAEAPQLRDMHEVIQLPQIHERPSPLRRSCYLEIS